VNGHLLCYDVLYLELDADVPDGAEFSLAQTENPVSALGFHFKVVVKAGSSSSASPLSCSQKD